MSIPKVAGTETEYAITGADPCTSSRRVVSAYPRISLSADGNPCVRRGGDDDLMLPNGARFYVDHAHPEYSTAESQNPATVVALERAGAEIVRRCAEYASSSGAPVRIYKNNSDHQGHSYGCHENYLVEAHAYADLFGNRAHLIYTFLVPFLVSRIIYTGAGKIGGENGAPEVPFQISQRADFFETVVGLQTTHARPIVNTRDEPHADPARFRRLHVIAGDANMCPYASWLKIGITQIMLRLLEDSALCGNLVLENPVQAVIQISHDPSCSHAVRLEDGRKLTALEMQREFLGWARRYFESNASSDVETALLEEWERTLAALQSDPQELTGKLDWVTKRGVLQGVGEACGWGFDSPQATAADVLYHALDPSESLYYPLEQMKLIAFPPGWDASAPERYLADPPEDSRAWLRGRCIARFGESVRDIDWEEIGFQKLRVKLPDPLAPCRGLAESLLLESDDLASFLDRVASGSDSLLLGNTLS